MFSLESPRWGNSKKNTQYILLWYNNKTFPEKTHKYLFSWAIGKISLVLKIEFEWAR